MKTLEAALSPIICIILMSGLQVAGPQWIREKRDHYSYNSTAADAVSKMEYIELLEKGYDEVSSFFGAGFKQSFEVFVHPNRHSLDSTWRKEWAMPDFKSECWMVASGVASRLDMISPKKWDKESCEHKYADIRKTQQLITHELVHVFHGQYNPSPDFSQIEQMDWFVEGLATYASGQLDSARIAQVVMAAKENKIPQGLDAFWTGQLRYGLSGTIVKYIDGKYGRETLKEILGFTRKDQVLKLLAISEPDLLRDWKVFVSKH